MRRAISRFTFLFLFAAMTAGVPALADQPAKIGFVNIDRLLRDAPLAIEAQKRLDKEFRDRRVELQKMADKLQAMQDALDRSGASLSQGARRDKEVELSDYSRNFQRRRRQYNEDVTQRRNEEQQAILERADKVIRRIAEAGKFDLILQEAVYASSRVDITDQVIKALGDGRR
jgi:outer membrane protein